MLDLLGLLATREPLGHSLQVPARSTCGLPRQMVSSVCRNQVKFAAGTADVLTSGASLRLAETSADFPGDRQLSSTATSSPEGNCSKTLSACQALRTRLIELNCALWHPQPLDPMSAV